MCLLSSISSVLLGIVVSMCVFLLMTVCVMLLVWCRCFGVTLISPGVKGSGTWVRHLVMVALIYVGGCLLMVMTDRCAVIVGVVGLGW